ncbi:nucleotidyltransferase domain-containing protein, partial [Bacillus cereus]
IERSVLNEIEKLLIKKKAGTELDVGLKIQVLNQFLEEQIDYYQQYVKGIEKGLGIDIESLNTLFRNMLFEVNKKEHK